MPGPIKNPSEAFQQLEAVMLRQMLHSSGAFTASDSPGAQLRTDMFIETLADAVAKAGGLGIARMLEKQLGATGAHSATATTTPPPGAHGAAGLPMSTPFTAVPGLPSFSALQGLAPATLRGSVGGGVAVGTGGLGALNTIDDLDDPNSERPLPEDPSAASIDDYQDPAPRPAAAPPSAHMRPHLRPPEHSAHSLDPLSPKPASGLLPNLSTHALNRYRERDESLRGGASSGAPVGVKKP